MEKPAAISSLLLLLGLFIIPSCLQAQDSAETWIRSIRFEVKAINAPGLQYRIEEDDSSYVSSEGSALKKYFEGNHLRKLTVDAFWAIGRTTLELYLSRDTLIFCYEETTLFAGPMAEKTGQ